MPEGDSVHRHARALDAALVGHKVSALYARGVAYAGLVGETITLVQARGKHLLIDVGPRARLHVHLGMNGRMQIAPGAAMTVPRAARASLAIATDTAVVFWTAARTVEILRAAFAHAHPALRALGPDLLADDFDPARAASRARQMAAERPLGEVLLDQRVAAGVGNIYKSEVLFLERLSPWTRVSELDDQELARLYQRAGALMRANLGPWRRTTTANLSRGDAVPPALGRHHVYRRHRLPCPACGTPIARRAQGQPPRSTYYCPHCQPGTQPGTEN